MTFTELRREFEKGTLGVGVVEVTKNNHVIPYFYEDFKKEGEGLERAKETFTRLLNKGKTRVVWYLYCANDLQRVNRELPIYLSR